MYRKYQSEWGNVKSLLLEIRKTEGVYSHQIYSPINERP